MRENNLLSFGPSPYDPIGCETSFLEYKIVDGIIYEGGPKFMWLLWRGHKKIVGLDKILKKKDKIVLDFDVGYNG